MELLMFQSLRSETGVDRQSLRQTLSLRRRRKIASSVSTTRVRGSANGSRKSSENALSVSLRNALIMTYTKAWSGTRRKKICENSCRRARAATGDTASAYGSTKRRSLERLGKEPISIDCHITMCDSRNCSLEEEHKREKYSNFTV